jgi:serine/threonine protein kinase/TolB-like protein/tetratricopeptide (TPR) repeat protein
MVKPDRWQQISRLYHDALARDEHQRAAFLDEACAGDAELRREVGSLLGYQGDAKEFIEAPALDVMAKGLAGAPALSMSGRQIGVYKILSLLGSGGMGEVYRARDGKLGRDVAIKVLPVSCAADPDRLHRLEREARLLAALNHPHIAAIYGLEEFDGVCGLVLELVEGPTLAELLAQGSGLKAQGLPLDEALTIARQIAEALEAAHVKGIVHRDLKPANIKVTPDGMVKVLDFGLAKVLADDGSPADLSQLATTTIGGTREGMILGTAGYMSPEQARGKPLDKRTDIWSFGCVLYEALAGRPAFPGETVSDSVAKILEREPDWDALPTSTPEKIRDLLRRCLQKDPKRRLHDIADARIELQETLTIPAARSGVRKLSTMSRRLRWGMAAAAAVLALSMVALYLSAGRERLWGPASPGRPMRIAVLPIVNLSGDRGEDYFAAGMTDALIADLAQLAPDDLRVISRTSVMRYQGDTKKSMPEIGRELDVGALVEASVVRVGDKVRITAQLIQASTDQHLWARSYERDSRDVLALQGEVSRAIAQEIRVKLSPQQQQRLASAHAVNPKAHEAYLKGLGLRGQPAIAAFEEASRLDPEYAAPYAGLANVYYGLTYFGVLSPQEGFSKVKAAATAALARDNALPDAYAALALVSLHYDWNWAAAEQGFKRALELNPSQADIHHFYSHYLLAMGREEESLAESHRASETDPFNAGLASCVGWHCLYSGQYDKSIKYSLDSLQINPNLFFSHMFLGWAYEQKSMFGEAVTEQERAVKLSGGNPMAIASFGRACALSGRRTDALKVLAELNDRSKHGYASAYDIATVYMALNDREHAFEWLERAFAERSSLLVHFGWDPRFRDLRADPRSQDLMRRMGLPQKRVATTVALLAPPAKATAR